MRWCYEVFENAVLVTRARHMERGELCFRKLGAHGRCLSDSNWVAQKWVALLYYRLRGWIRAGSEGPLTKDH